MIRLYILYASIAILSSYNVSAQTVSAINNQVGLTNYIAENVKRQADYMSDLYVQFNRWRNNPQIIIRYEVNKGMRQPDGYLYTKANTNNSWTDTIWKDYQALFDLNNQLMAYIKLGDYKGDNASEGIEIIEKMEQLILLLSEHRDKLKTNILSTLPVNNKTYQLMIETVVYAEKILNMLDNSYLKDELKVFDEDFLVTSYLETEKLLARLNDDHEIQYPASSYFKSFISGLESLQKVKQRAADENSFTHQKSMAYTNKLYDYYLNYFNNDLLVFFNHFIDAVGQPPLNNYPKYIPHSRYRDYKFEVNVVARECTITEVLPLDVQPTDKRLNRLTYDLLNGYIEALNERTRQLKNLQSYMSNYQRTLIRLKQYDREALERYRFIFSYEHFTVPAVDYAILKTKAPEALADYSSTLLTELTNIQEIMLETERLCEELAVFTENKDYLQQGFSRPEEILGRLHQLFKIYLEKSQQLYADARKVYETFKIDNASNPWKVTSEVMLNAVDASKSTLKEIEIKFFDDHAKTIETAGLLSLRRDMVANQSKYMGNIKRLGRGHGHCPYTPYEYIPDKIKSLVDKIEYLNGYLEKGDFSRYADYVYVYNDIVSNYNKYAELGKGDVESAQNDSDRPVYILYHTTTFAPFILDNSYVPPKQQQEKPAPAIANSVELEPVKNTKPTNKISHVNSGQNIIRDTVYVETIRTDTVYLYEDDVSFTSFEGYAHNNLVFLLDASGSMNTSDRLPLLKESIKYLVGLMRSVDDISIIVYSGKAKLALKPTPASEREKIKAIIDELKSEGLTNVNDGIQLAYKIADKNYKRGGNNRIILATDGEIQVGKSISKLIEKFSDEDIYLSVFTFGDHKISTTAQALADKGKGNYKHITRQNINSELIREAKSKKD